MCGSIPPIVKPPYDGVEQTMHKEADSVYVVL